MGRKGALRSIVRVLLCIRYTTVDHRSPTFHTTFTDKKQWGLRTKLPRDNRWVSGTCSVCYVHGGDPYSAMRIGRSYLSSQRSFRLTRKARKLWDLRSKIEVLGSIRKIFRCMLVFMGPRTTAMRPIRRLQNLHILQFPISLRALANALRERADNRWAIVRYRHSTETKTSSVFSRLCG